MPGWLINSKIKEAIKGGWGVGGKASFKKWESCPNVEDKIEHQMWQHKW